MASAKRLDSQDRRQVLPPDVRPEPWRRNRRSLVRSLDWQLLLGSAILVSFLLITITPQFVTHSDPYRVELDEAVQPPSSEHWFGTDELGRDLLARVAYGARATLAVAVGALTLSTVVGTSVGVLGGYFRGFADEVLMRLLDILLAFPGVVLAIAIAAGLGPGVLNLSIAMGVYAIPIFARISRGVVLSVAAQDYVLAARAIGAPDWRIIVSHISPNILNVILVQIVVRFGLIVLSAAALGFLGLGVRPPQPEWGQLIYSGVSYLGVASHLMLFPGLALMATVLGFNLIGDWLQEIMDPRLRGRI